MTRANSGWSAAPSGSSMISRSEKRLTRNGSTEARSSGPPRLKSRTAVGWLRMDEASHGAGEHGPPIVGRQVPVEHHAHVANEQAAEIRDRQSAARDAHEPVGRWTSGFDQALQFG